MYRMLCKQIARAHTPSSRHPCERRISFFSCGTPFYFRSVSPFRSPACFLSSRLSFRSVVSPSSLVRDGEPNGRALFIQLPYLNVALTRRKIICKNPHKICKSPSNAPGNCRVISSRLRDYYIARRCRLPPSITSNEKGWRAFGRDTFEALPFFVLPPITSSLSLATIKKRRKPAATKIIFQSNHDINIRTHN